ncbi:hypothetical protein QM012_002630 [Aureobasidium pullulans]|uniref:Zn(2)-C6 fungal-type domain-containing protein n=1 Tax=Aureobasidium pullulans TaxID=5580 RepID=A0ABR0TAP4_AURPU
MDYQDEFDLANVAPLPFDDDDFSYDQTHLDGSFPADAITYPYNNLYFGEDPMMTNGSLIAAPVMEMSPALQALRNNNPFSNAAGHQSIYGFQSSSLSLLDIVQTSGKDATRPQQLTISNEGPIQVSNGTIPSTSTLDGSKPVPKIRKKATKLRVTCESCRQLKIKCHPTTDGASCEKCLKKGIPCVRKARAPYRSAIRKSSS